MMIDAARALRADLADTLDGQAVVTLDAAGAGALLPAGPVVIIDPPEVTWHTTQAIDITWTIYIVAGPTHDLEQAAETIWSVITTLADNGTTPDTARPSAFQPQNGPAHPAYTLTITEPYNT